MSTSASPVKPTKSSKPKAKPTPKVPHPPIPLSPESWARRTQSPVYIKHIKRMVQATSTYRLLVHGDSRRLSRQQRNALHYFADTAELTEDNRRRSRRADDDTPTSYTDAGTFGDATPVNGGGK